MVWKRQILLSCCMYIKLCVCKVTAGLWWFHRIFKGGDIQTWLTICVATLNFIVFYPSTIQGQPCLAPEASLGHPDQGCFPDGLLVFRQPGFWLLRPLSPPEGRGHRIWVTSYYYCVETDGRDWVSATAIPASTGARILTHLLTLYQV